MTQSQNQSKTISIQSKGIEEINKANREKNLRGNKRLLVRYKKYRSLDLEKGKLTKYWDSKIQELEKLISKNSTWLFYSFNSECWIYKRALCPLFLCHKTWHLNRHALKFVNNKVIQQSEQILRREDLKIIEKRLAIKYIFGL